MMAIPEEIPGFGDKVKELMDRFGIKRCNAFVMACRMMGMGQNSTCAGRQKTLNDRSAAVARARALIAQKKRVSFSEK